MNEITVNVKLAGVDEATQKAVALIQKIEEARTLAGELASLIEKLEIEL